MLSTLRRRPLPHRPIQRRHSGRSAIRRPAARPEHAANPRPVHTPFGGRFTQVVAFGDSLSDSGNLLPGTCKFRSGYYPGRFSNGPLWLEHLTDRLGLPVPAPSLAGGTNYAWASAETGAGHSSQGVPNVLTQVGDFLSRHVPGPGQLIAVWGGGNDFMHGQRNPAVPVRNLVAAITALAEAGARHFLVPNLPLLGHLPGAQGLSRIKRWTVNALTVVFNTLLAAKLRRLEKRLGITIHRLDVQGLVQELRANPSGFGLANVTGAALKDREPARQDYLFFDEIHPTTTGHRLIGERAFALVAAPQRFALGVRFAARAGAA